MCPGLPYTVWDAILSTSISSWPIIENVTAVMDEMKKYYLFIYFSDISQTI